MTIKEIYDLAIRLGIENDLRGSEAVLRRLSKVKQEYEKLTDEKKENYNKEKLTNPYSDTVILHDNGKEIKKVMVGIDIGVAELLLAKEIGDIDLVISHHPLGRGLSDLSEVMNLQTEVLAAYGVPIHVAQSLTEPRITEVWRGISPSNHHRVPDAAKLLNQGLMCVHTPCDNLVATFLRKEIETKSFEYVSEILELLKSIPEYSIAEKNGLGPCLFAGSEKNFCGKIALTEITGGTEGTPKIYDSLSNAGIGTIVGMHMSEKHVDHAKKAHINAIIAGHISSDSLGVNLFLDELEKNGIEIIPISGLTRVSRIHI